MSTAKAAPFASSSSDAASHSDLSAAFSQPGDDIASQDSQDNHHNENDHDNFIGNDNAHMDHSDDEDDDDASDVSTSSSGSSSSSSSSLDGDNAISPYDELSLPEYACRYCGIHDPACVARCVETRKWLCNATCPGGGGSHLVNHLVRSRSNQVQLHPESPLGDTVLECYNCASKNAFVLGFVPASSSSVVVLLCRVCVETVPALKDMDWELAQWCPLVQDRKFLPWLIKVR